MNERLALCCQRHALGAVHHGTVRCSGALLLLLCSTVSRLRDFLGSRRGSHPGLCSICGDGQSGPGQPHTLTWR